MTVDVIDGTTQKPTAYGLPDLLAIAQMLRSSVENVPPRYIAGKTVLRDAVMDRLICSALHAERIVDQLESRGLIRFETSHRAPRGYGARWVVGGPAPSHA